MHHPLPFLQKAALHFMPGVADHASPFLPSTKALLITPFPDKSLAKGSKMKISSYIKDHLVLKHEANLSF